MFMFAGFEHGKSADFVDDFGKDWVWDLAGLNIVFNVAIDYECHYMDRHAPPSVPAGSYCRSEQTGLKPKRSLGFWHIIW